MGEVGQQASPAASAPALDRADRHVKDSRSILDRVALHIDEHECGALLEGQLRQRQHHRTPDMAGTEKIEGTAVFPEMLDEL